MDNHNKKVLVTGAHGFVGHAVVALLKKRGYTKILTPTSKECDITKEDQVSAYFDKNSPQIVLHIAGKVGGIAANKANPGEFFYKNLMMGTLIMEYAKRHNCEKTVVLAAGCGYPKFLEVPYTEEDFWMGMPDENSIGYSMAKKMLVIQSWTYREEYGFDSTVLLPANLYGPHDNFDLESSHVVPALLRKFIEAKDSGATEVEVWGDGSASREFLYVDDTARAIVDASEKDVGSGPFNLGTGTETTIKELITTISEETGFDGDVIWDTSRPNGQPRRFYNMSKFQEAFGYVPSTSLKDGLKKTIEWYRNNDK
jgi:GDP-L-fucose synthase